MAASGDPPVAPGATRAAFEAGLGFPLDPFQTEALDALDAGHSVLVAAPTGSGKTLVAEYAIAVALDEGAKAFYTTPLKALSNQKYGDLVRVHGRDRVGLLTGDTSVNGDAPVVVMTTEVLRNMIYARSALLDGLRYVVLDEVHYLQNPYRGAVWEEVIIHLPPGVDLVCLSATVSNAEELADWIETVRGSTSAVIEERRPVELEHWYAVGERGRGGFHLFPTFVRRNAVTQPNPDVARLDRRVPRGGPVRGRGGAGRARGRLYTPYRVEVTERLAAEDLLPAISFVFSRAGCSAAVEQCLDAGVRLTTADERRDIRAIAERHVEGLSDDDLEVLRADAWLAGLEAGVAAHHAGMVPPMKEAVEEAFAAGLVKMVFATETLSLGINMPARSVVIEKLSKFTGERHEFLTPGEYTQLAGRAGRRGIDTTGHVIVLWNPFVPFDQVAALASRRTYELTSSFRPTYNMAANLVRRYGAEEAHHLLNLSFAQYRADREVVAIERQLDRTTAQLAQQRALAPSDAGDVAEYRRLLAEVEAHRRARGASARIGPALEALRPGDVVYVGKRGGRVAVLKQEHQRGPKVLVLTTSRDLVRLGADDFDTPPTVIAHVELPRPFAPRSPAFRRTVAEALRRLRVREERRRGPSGTKPRPGLEGPPSSAEQALHGHPLHSAPGLDRILRAAVAAERLERERQRLERRVRSRSESLARLLDRVLRVLESRGYVDGWSLTVGGELLARLYTESDLLLAEALREGLLDGVSPPELAALVSCVTYERRGPDTGGPPPRVPFPTAVVARGARELERIWRGLAADEDDAGLPETRAPDGGFTPLAYAWADGDELVDILDDDELTGGDFVRQCKQIIDVLRQLGEVAPDEGIRRTARAAVDACFRGVVAASSTVGA
ncbi:MAG: DEAD/DEAH box helicase [Acidimicrobiia bacterium]